MKPEHEPQLEAQIDRELKALPELPAPPALAARVMMAIESRANRAWYRKPWQMWPPALQAVSLGLLLALFAGLCVLGVRMGYSGIFSGVAQRLRPLLAGASAFGNVLNVLWSAVVLAVQQLGTGLLLAVVTALAVGYAMCLGLGTVCVRLALARR
jgi:hypothetical protein